MQASEDNALEYLRKKIRDMMNVHADHVATGGVADWSEYRHQIGIIEGLAKAERELLDLEERLGRQD
jgi:hypothetical protein